MIEETGRIILFFKDMFVYLLYIKEAYVNIFRVTINDVQDDPCMILGLVYDIWVCSI